MSRELVIIESDDLRLAVLAAASFNMGFVAREDRDQEDTERLWDACERLGALVGLEVRREDVNHRDSLVDGPFIPGVDDEPFD